ncbi:hypothetical protein HBI12_227270 [Parastagonospora nodorum]|nr:hypothetical protein HBI12_227270 [Parastagonospora nodorum]
MSSISASTTTITGAAAAAATQDVTREYDELSARNYGLGELFPAQVKRSPGATALRDGAVVLTYDELHALASIAAAQLAAKGMRAEEPVGIVAMHGAACVIGQLAIVYAGGTCVPLDAALPDEIVQRRLERLRARLLLADEANVRSKPPLYGYSSLSGRVGGREALQWTWLLGVYRRTNFGAGTDNARANVAPDPHVRHDSRAQGGADRRPFDPAHCAARAL